MNVIGNQLIIHASRAADSRTHIIRVHHAELRMAAGPMERHRAPDALAHRHRIAHRHPAMRHHADEVAAERQRKLDAVLIGAATQRIERGRTAAACVTW